MILQTPRIDVVFTELRPSKVTIRAYIYFVLKGAYCDYRLKNVICFIKYLIYLQIDFRKLHHRSPDGFDMTANCNFSFSHYYLP